jgi:hypothetical protein
MQSNKPAPAAPAKIHFGLSVLLAPIGAAAAPQISDASKLFCSVS